MEPKATKPSIDLSIKFNRTGNAVDWIDPKIGKRPDGSKGPKMPKHCQLRVVWQRWRNLKLVEQQQVWPSKSAAEKKYCSLIEFSYSKEFKKGNEFICKDIAFLHKWLIVGVSFVSILNEQFSFKEN